MMTRAFHHRRKLGPSFLMLSLLLHVLLHQVTITQSAQLCPILFTFPLSPIKFTSPSDNDDLAIPDYIHLHRNLRGENNRSDSQMTTAAEELVYARTNVGREQLSASIQAIKDYYYYDQPSTGVDSNFTTEVEDQENIYFYVLNLKSGFAEYHKSLQTITHENDVDKRKFCFMVNQESGKVQNCTSLNDMSLVPPCVSISSLSAIYEKLSQPTTNILLRMYIDSIYYENGKHNIHEAYLSNLEYLIDRYGGSTISDSYEISVLNGVVAESAAESLLSYFHDYLERNFIAILYTGNKYALDFKSHFLSEAEKVGMNAISFGYNDWNEKSLSIALQKVKQSNFRTIIIAPQESQFAAIEQLIAKAFEYGLVGSDFLWICHHYNSLSVELMKDAQSLSIVTADNEDTTLSTFMQGLGVFVPSVNKTYFEGLHELIESDNSSIIDFCQSDYENGQAFSDICDTADDNKVGDVPHALIPSAFAYDSTRASLNGLMNSLSLSESIFQNVVEDDFVGMTGNVSFNSLTHTRSNGSMQFQMFNFQKNEGSFHLVNTAEDRGDNVWIKVTNFQYADLSYDIPAIEYGVEEDKGYIDSNLRKICISVASFGILVTLYCMVKVWVYKESDKLALMQPLFLFMICGTSLLRYMTAIAIFIDDGISFVSNEGMVVTCALRFWPAALGQITCQFIYIVKFILIENDVNTSSRSNWMVVLYYFPFCLMTIVYIFLFYILVSVNTAISWSRENLLEDDYGFVIVSEGSCKLKKELSFRITVSIFIAALGVVAVIIIGRRCKKTVSNVDDFRFHDDFKRIYYCSYFDSVIFSAVIFHSLLTWIFFADAGSNWFHSRTYQTIRFMLIYLLAAGNVHVIVYKNVRVISDLERKNNLANNDNNTAEAVHQQTGEEGLLRIGAATSI